MSMTYIEPCCPICGSKGYVMHDVIPEGSFGWSAGCPVFKLDDGIHGMDEDTPRNKWPRVDMCLSKEAATAKWTVWVRKWEADNGGSDT